MFKRFKSGLFSPSEVVNYRFDKKITTIIYLLILVILSILPSLIAMMGNNTLNYADKRVIREGFIKAEIPYKIEDNRLMLSAPYANEYQEIQITEQIRVVITEHSDFVLPVNAFDTSAIIILAREGVYYQRTFSHVFLFRYSDYPELQNLDLALAGVDDFHFWETVFAITNQQLSKYTVVSVLINLAIIALASLIGLLFFGLLVSLFQKLTVPFIRFGQYFQLIIYLLTPYVVCQLIGSLFGFDLLPFIGVLLTVIYASRLNRKLIQE